MKQLWQKIVDGQNMPLISDGCFATVKMLSDDFSYVAQENNGLYNHLDELSEQQRQSHPKFIHSKGIVGTFLYVPFGEVKNNLDSQELCNYNMEGIFRIGPANITKVNLIGQAFKFFPIHSSVSYNLLLLGGSTKPIDSTCPPSIGEIDIYASNTSFVNNSENKDVQFLAKAFSDLVKDPSVLDTSAFLKSENNSIYFIFNEELQQELLKVKHTASVVENMKDVINHHMHKKNSKNYELGSFETITNKSIIIRLGTVYLLSDVIISNYADRYLFFQHNLLHMNTQNTKCLRKQTLNENDNNKTFCNLLRRLKYFFQSKTKTLKIALT